MRVSLVLVLLLSLSACSHVRPRPEIMFQKAQGESPVPIRDLARADWSKEKSRECKVHFANTYPRKKPYEKVGTLRIPEGAYGDGSEQGYLQIQDLVERLRPFACSTEANMVILREDPKAKGIQEAELIRVNFTRPRS